MRMYGMAHAPIAIAPICTLTRHITVDLHHSSPACSPPQCELLMRDPPLFPPEKPVFTPRTNMECNIPHTTASVPVQRLTAWHDEFMEMADDGTTLKDHYCAVASESKNDLMLHAELLMVASHLMAGFPGAERDFNPHHIVRSGREGGPRGRALREGEKRTCFLVCSVSRPANLVWVGLRLAL